MAHAGGLDDDVGVLARLLDRPGVVGGAEVADQLRLRPVGDAVQHVGVEPALDREEGGQVADGAGGGDQGLPWLKRGAPADELDVLYSIGYHRGRLQWHAN